MSNSSEAAEVAEVIPGDVPVKLLYQDSKSSADSPMDQWSSLFQMEEKENPKMNQYKQGLYDPGSGEICAKYIAMSDSEVFRHVYYAYPGIKDPGIMDALFQLEKPQVYDSNGQQLYLELCAAMGVCPVRSFHRGLMERDINLRYYSINPVGVRAISRALLFNTTVKRLDLSSNVLSLDACYHLGKLLAENVVLTELVLTGCKLGLRSNGLGAEAASSLAAALEVNNSVTHLDLSWNQLFPPKGSNELIRVLGDSNVLVELNLSWNALTTGLALRKLLTPKLTRLNMANNRLTSLSVRAICKGMKKARHLAILDLSFNPLTDTDALLLLETLKERDVRVQTLLMDGIDVEKKFAMMLREVLSMSHRAGTTVTHGRVLHDFAIAVPDMREIVLKRLLAVTSTKKCSMDVALYFLATAKLTDAIQTRDLMRDMKAAGAVPDDELVDGIANVFPGPLTEKGGKTIALAKVTEFVRRLWPDKQLPPTPPPELVKEEIGKKDKKNKKSKK